MKTSRISTLVASHWTHALVAVVVLYDPSWPTVLGSLALVFRQEVSIALLRRRISVEVAGCKASLDDAGLAGEAGTESGSRPTGPHADP